MLIESKNYVAQMVPFVKFALQNIHRSAFDPKLLFYGTGENAHWPTQSNCNVFAGFATMATVENYEEYVLPISQDEMRVLALTLLRYALRTHITGDAKCSNGGQWGNSWISILGFERMSHGLNLIRPYLNSEDQERLRNLVESEADWLLNEYEVVADIDGTSGKNKPESNAWNGGFLLRASLDYPELPNSSRYREKASSFLLNAISVPADASCSTVFNHKMVSEWHVGANFTENYALDHHAYLNVGYMVITLSHLAMLHFNFKMRNQPIAPEIYWHVDELWQLMRKLTFPDGRLFRIGGDTRSRYTYCQLYAIPIWLMIADIYGDNEALLFEKNYLDVIATEQQDNSNGSFMGRRLDKLRKISPYYYYRLESDFFVALSYGATYRRLFELPQVSAPSAMGHEVWHDEFAGGFLERTPEVIRSFAWRGGQGPCSMCLPTTCSNMAEWQYNMHGELKLYTRADTRMPHFHTGELIEGGFITSGEHLWFDGNPQGEGEASYDFAKHQSATVALPDGKTSVVIEQITITKNVFLKAIKGFHYLLPNDVQNNFTRHIKSANVDMELTSRPTQEEIIELKDNYVTIDDKVTLQAIYGGDFTLYREAKDNIILRHSKIEMASLYAEEFVVGLSLDRECRVGDVVIDGAYLATVSGQALECRKLEIAGNCRGVEVVDSNNHRYKIIANFSAEPICYEGLSIPVNGVKLFF